MVEKAGPELKSFQYTISKLLKGGPWGVQIIPIFCCAALLGDLSLLQKTEVVHTG